MLARFANCSDQYNIGLNNIQYLSKFLLLEKGPEVKKNMLNSAEHEMLFKIKIFLKNQQFLGSDRYRMIFSST